jgi:hypothetical protein
MEVTVRCVDGKSTVVNPPYPKTQDVIELEGVARTVAEMVAHTYDSVDGNKADTFATAEFTKDLDLHTFEDEAYGQDYTVTLRLRLRKIPPLTRMKSILDRQRDPTFHDGITFYDLTKEEHDFFGGDAILSLINTCFRIEYEAVVAKGLVPPWFWEATDVYNGFADSYRVRVQTRSV